MLQVVKKFLLFDSFFPSFSTIENIPGKKLLISVLF